MTRIRSAAILVPLLVLLSACKSELLAPAGDIATQQRDLLFHATLLMLLIVVPVMFLIVFFAWKYRASNKDVEYLPDWHHSTKLELVIWAAPLAIIICLGALTWVGTHRLDPFRPLDRISATKALDPSVETLEVEVVALDWKWLFIYPQYGIATVNELAAPVDRPIHFKLTGTTVMNAFYVPTLAGMIYTMPAMTSELNAVVNHEGIFKGMSANYSGAGFAGMNFKFHGLSTQGFDDWISKVRASGKMLGRPEFLDLERPSERVAPAYYGQVDSDLFHAIVNLCVNEGKMCMDEMMAIDAQGGLGLAGISNVTALEYDRYARRGTVLRPVPYFVTALCTPEDSQKSFGNAAALPRDFSMDAPRAPVTVLPAASVATPAPVGAGQSSKL